MYKVSKILKINNKNRLNISEDWWNKIRAHFKIDNSKNVYRLARKSVILFRRGDFDPLARYIWRGGHDLPIN